MMHPEHRVESRRATWAHVSREVSIVNGVMQALYVSSTRRGIAILRAGNIGKRLILRKNVVK